MVPTMRRPLALLLALTLVAGCGPPRIDGSSDESFQASYEQVRNALEEDERERFEDAIRAIDTAPLFGPGA
jgi:hypothetical protein